MFFYFVLNAETTGSNIWPRAEPEGVTLCFWNPSLDGLLALWLPNRTFTAVLSHDHGAPGLELLVRALCLAHSEQT